MKKILILLFLVFIANQAQLCAMKRSNNQAIRRIAENPQEIYLPSEIITIIAAMCDSLSRANLSLTNTLFNNCASLKKNPNILNQPEFTIEKENKIYYLFYACIYNIKTLIPHTLKCFDPEKTAFMWPEIYIKNPDKILLNEIKFCIEQLTQNDTTKLLPYYSDAETKKIKNTLNWAIKKRDKKLVQLLLKQPTVDINKHSSIENRSLSPLHIALQDALLSEKLNILKLLLSNPSLDVNSTDSKGNNHPLHFILAKTYQSASDSHIIFCEKIIKLFLTHPEIKINATEKLSFEKDLPVLSRAIYYDYNEIVKLLLTHPDIDVNLPDASGDTPLHWAINTHNLEVLRLLLVHPDISINTPGSENNTLLHCAILQNNEDAVQLLLTHYRTINFNAQNDDGYTPVLLAQNINKNFSDFSNLQSQRVTKNFFNNMDNQINELKKSTSIFEKIIESQHKKNSLDFYLSTI
jgi:ankyrin repeat protein